MTRLPSLPWPSQSSRGGRSTLRNQKDLEIAFDATVGWCVNGDFIGVGPGRFAALASTRNCSMFVKQCHVYHKHGLMVGIPAIQCQWLENMAMVHNCFTDTTLYTFVPFCVSFFTGKSFGISTDHQASQKSQGEFNACEVMDHCIVAPATPLHRRTARSEFVDAHHLFTKWQQNQKERNKHELKK